MPFEKGNKLGSGRPKAKPWTEALNLVANQTVVENDGAKKKRLRKLAEKTFDAAMQGDMAAVKEIGNRLEGTPVQSVEMETGDNLAGLLSKIAGATRGLPNDDGE